MRNILFVASECYPFIKTGGLADVVGALPKMINKDEFDVRVVIPKYMCIPWEYRQHFQYVTSFYMDLGYFPNHVYVGIMMYEHEGIKYYFIDNGILSLQLLNADTMSALLLRGLKKTTPLVIIIVILTLPVAM